MSVDVWDRRDADGDERIQLPPTSQKAAKQMVHPDGPAELRGAKAPKTEPFLEPGNLAVLLVLPSVSLIRRTTGKADFE